MRSQPGPGGSEAEMLWQYLDVQRAALLDKTEGLDLVQMAQLHPPSILTLAGLLYHLSLAEEDWMEIHFSGQPDRDPFVHADWDADPEWQFRVPAGIGRGDGPPCCRSRRPVARGDRLQRRLAPTVTRADPI